MKHIAVKWGQGGELPFLGQVPLLLGSPFCGTSVPSESKRSLLLAWLGIFKVITVKHNASGQGRKSDIVYDELLCGKTRF